MDLTNPLPFPDNCVTQIYSSHLLEHIDYPNLIALLSQCHRVLKSGGLFKVAVPNARLFLDAYFHPEEFDAAYYCRYEPGLHYNSAIDYVNYVAYMGGQHRYLFDEENLTVLLVKTGFKSVRPRDFDPSLDLVGRRFESIYAEGMK